MAVQTISFHGRGVGVLTFVRALHSMIDRAPSRSAPEILLSTWQVCFSFYAGEQHKEKVSAPPGSTPAVINTRKICACDGHVTEATPRPVPRSCCAR